MTALLVTVFVLAYTAIALEEPLKVNKSAAALIGAGLLWTIYAMATGLPEIVDEELNTSLVETAQIAFFLLGAMTIVEVIDAHDGFAVITSRLRASTLATLMMFICVVTFFLSAILDNLTTTIVMISLCKRLLADRSDRLLFAGMIVIAANAGGAWSPMGDVTTTMLWIGGQVTTTAIIGKLILPSLVNMAVPLAIVAYGLRGKPILAPEKSPAEEGTREIPPFERNLIFTAGLLALVSVPVFKTVTHLPPFLGMLFGLGILWALADRVHMEKPYGERKHVTIAHALARIDMSAITFFIGILLAVATLEHSGVLHWLADWLDQVFGRLDLIVIAIGFVSAVVDNVPMVAGAMGMYSMDVHPTDSFLWEFLAYCAGTGGSILIIGSAAGVAAMGLERIDFIWYLKRFSLLALVGYLAGAAVYILQQEVIGHAALV
ncbi:sodium:proton antiporter [Altererythrobacter salegens]|uniref:Sodium:proton antiporter n=1 Tax=Croceibacterium salegens TaxID=1737568 RepID=A0A6I4STA9_9SPHN|nr:sodium:proton antiporter NhaD [Croceibacterium salegens]MXO58136.1 sodium:proton antiporter [Croceibacterium salegens]